MSRISCLADEAAGETSELSKYLLCVKAGRQLLSKVAGGRQVPESGERGTLGGREQGRNSGYLGAAPLTRLSSMEEKHQSGSSVSSDACKTREGQVFQKSGRRLIWGFTW